MLTIHSGWWTAVFISRHAFNSVSPDSGSNCAEEEFYSICVWAAVAIIQNLSTSLGSRNICDDGGETSNLLHSLLYNLSRFLPIY